MPETNGTMAPIYDADGTPLQMAADGLAVPHVVTFASIYSSAYRTYLHEKFDEALRKSPQYALDIQRDAHIQGCLQERKLAVVSRKWHLEVDDPKDKWQMMVKDGLTKVVQRTPFLKKLMWAELDAIWYGKSGVQARWWWQGLDLAENDPLGEPVIDPILDMALPELTRPQPQGAGYQSKPKQRALCVEKWKPVHGDKFGNKFDGTPYLLITPWVADAFRKQGYETTLTTRGGYGLVLSGSLRERFILHSHELVDEDFFQAEKGEAIFGLGLRDRLFWSWWLRQEYLGWVVDFLERVGLGVTVWYYDASNPQSKADTEKAAREQSRRSVILCPMWPDGRGGKMQPLVDRLETPTGGSEVLLAMMDTMRNIEQRLINGQDLSAQTKATGIGGDAQADFKADTKFQITAYDCENLAESLTGSDTCPSLVSTAKKWTYPWADFPVRWMFNASAVDPEKKLEAVKTFVDMGGSVIEDEARALVGMSDPQEDDVTLGGKEQLMAAQGLDAEGKPIREPGEEKSFGKNGDGKVNEDAPPNGEGPHKHVKFSREERLRYADEGQWITIGGHPGPKGKHEGGFHVKVDAEGNITEGPKWLKEKGVTHLKGAHGHAVPEEEKEPEKKESEEKGKALVPLQGSEVAAQPGKHGKFQFIIDELTYRSYRHNRRLQPEISPERWKKLFGHDAVEAMEERLQAEKPGSGSDDPMILRPPEEYEKNELEQPRQKPELLGDEEKGKFARQSDREHVPVDEHLWADCQELIPVNKPDTLPFLLGKLNRSIKVLLVDGNRVKAQHDMDFVEGNNWCESPEYIPGSEIWLDASIDVNQLAFILYHEAHESRLMQKGWTYEEAHDSANAAEKELRMRRQIATCHRCGTVLQSDGDRVWCPACAKDATMQALPEATWKPEV